MGGFPSKEIENNRRKIVTERDSQLKFIMDQAALTRDDSSKLREELTKHWHASYQFAAEDKKLTYLKPQLDKLFWTSVITFFLGVIMMVVGFWNWYFKFQTYQDRLVKAQAEQWTTPKTQDERRLGSSLVSCVILATEHS